MKTYMKFTSEMANWVRQGRDSLKLGQAEVARGVKMPSNTLTKLETGSQRKILVLQWHKLVSYYKGKGVPPLGTATQLPLLLPAAQVAQDDFASVIQELKSIKETTQTSWRLMAQTLGIHQHTLAVLFKEGKLGEQAMGKVREGLRKLKGLDKELVAAGIVEEIEREVVPAPTSRGLVAISTSQAVPVGLPSRLELLNEKRLLIDEMLRMHEVPHVPGHIFNGVGPKAHS